MNYLNLLLMLVGWEGWGRGVPRFDEEEESTGDINKPQLWVVKSISALKKRTMQVSRSRFEPGSISFAYQQNAFNYPLIKLNQLQRELVQPTVSTSSIIAHSRIRTCNPVDPESRSIHRLSSSTLCTLFQQPLLSIQHCQLAANLR